MPSESNHPGPVCEFEAAAYYSLIGQKRRDPPPGAPPQRRLALRRARAVLARDRLRAHAVGVDSDPVAASRDATFYEKGVKKTPALSVLDLSPVSAGKGARDALLATVDLARHAESLGLRRYWVAEHHNAKGLACSTPAVSIAVIAAATTTLRVGSGGVMLPNHAPLQVAEAFRTLEGFFPGRIDLGLGRAPGTDPRTARLLRRARDAAETVTPDGFPEALASLLAFLGDHEPPRGAFATSVVAIPAVDTSPQLFVLGSTDAGGALAAKLGLGFAFAHHFSPDDAAATMRAYRRDFVPSASWTSPYGILAVAAFAAETDADLEDYKVWARLSGLRFALGLRDHPMPSVAEAKAHVLGAEDAALIAGFEGRAHVGRAADVRDRLRALAEKAGADEVMVMTTAPDHELRKRSYALLAAGW
jgi:luciferase family oxidoreductase group 1